MKKLVQILLAVLTLLCQISFQTVSVNAEITAINSSTKQPQSATVYYVDYFNNKAETNPVDLTITYDSKGRVFDDGMSYHFYDGNDHEINLAYPGYVYPSFELGHYFYGPYYEFKNEYDIVFNSFGSPQSIQGEYSSMSFDYFENGNLKSIVYTDTSRQYITTFEYSGDKVSRLISNAVSPDTYWSKLEQVYSYSGDLLSYIDCSLYVNGSSAVYTSGRQVFEYNSENQLISVKDTFPTDPSYLSQAKTYTYDEKGQLAEIEIYQMGEGESGYKIYFNNYGGKPYKPHKNDALLLTGTTPDTGGWNNTFISSLTLNFNYDIEKINFDKGNIYIYDKETGQEAYRMPAEINPSTYIRSYQNKLTWVFPGVSSKKALTPGHTYYLKMDADFLTFKDTNKTISLGNNKDNPEWEFRVSSEEDDIISDEFKFKRTEKGTGTSKFVFNKAFFTSNSSTYNSSLARLSMDVAIAAYNSSDRSNGSEHITELFKKMEFENIWHNADYDGPTGDHTTGVCIGSKKLTPTKTLIAIAVRGGGYKDEWAGNFVLGENSTDHDGFSRGRENVINALKEFISTYDITGDVVFWVSGYSRASAIANLTAAYLDDGFSYNGISYGKGNVYAYCFEVPACTVSSSAGSAKYSNIFSIVNPYDLVCRMPLMQWGFTRYGNVMVLPYQYCGSYYNDYKGEVLDKFGKLSGHSLSSLPPVEMINDINTIMSLAGRYVESRSEYYNKAQDGISAKVREALGGGEVDDSELPAVYLMYAYLLKEIGGDVLSSGLETIITMYSTMSSMQARVKKLIQIYHSLKTVKSAKNAYDYATEEQLKIPHYAELTLAWMETLDGTGVLEKYEETSGTSESSRYASIFVKVHCPVDVRVYEKGTDYLLAQVVDNEADSFEDGPVICWADDTGAKTFSIPTQCDVYFVITPTDNGSMTITVSGEDMMEGSLLREISYENLELIKGETYHMDLSGGFDGTDYEADLYDVNEEWIGAEADKTADEIEYLSVDVLTEGYGDALPAINVHRGEAVILHAEPYENNHFLGWYDANGEELSKDENLIVTVDDNMTLTAKFTEKDPSTKSILPLIIGGVGILGVGVLVLLFVSKKKSQKLKS